MLPWGALFSPGTTGRSERPPGSALYGFGADFVRTWPESRRGTPLSPSGKNRSPRTPGGSGAPVRAAGPRFRRFRMRFPVAVGMRGGPETGLPGRGGGLGRSWVAPGRSWAGPGCSWAFPRHSCALLGPGEHVCYRTIRERAASAPRVAPPGAPGAPATGGQIEGPKGTRKHGIRSTGGPRSKQKHVLLEFAGFGGTRKHCTLGTRDPRPAVKTRAFRIPGDRKWPNHP